MKSEKQTFASLLDAFAYRYDLSTVFEDFLTLSLCAFSQNPVTGKSFDEDLYMETIGKYKTDELRHNLPKMLSCLTHEMEDQTSSIYGNDILGNYYELNLSKKKGKGQFFTPWSICTLMAQLNGNGHEKKERPLRILDPTCGSGRMLLAGAKIYGPHEEYYGIDIDPTCVKMTAINLFLNGIFHGEVICADALSSDYFRESYVLSFLPFGIFRITDKEKSRLWHMHKNSFPERKPKVNGQDLHLPSENVKSDFDSDASQLTLF